MRLLLYTFLLLALGTQCVAQEDTTRFFVEAGGVVATAQRTPFWLRANQFGTVPLENPFAFVKTGGQVTLGTNPRKAQLHLQGEVVANAGRSSSLLLPVASASFRYRRFEAYVGRKKEFFGLGDTLLTSGSYAWSGNAMPLPKVQIGTRGFVPLGFTKNFLAFQATFSHGWFGKQDSVHNYYLHQKSFYGRFGKPSAKLHFYIGILHNVQWGGDPVNPVKGLLSDGTYPSSFKDYLHLLVAKSPTGSNYSGFETLNQLGNHLGSIDFAISFKRPTWNLLVYHQHPYEDKSGLVFINFPDGLYGLRFKNNKPPKDKGLQINHVTIEYLNTLDKGNNIRPDLLNRYEPDKYFTHGQYTTGWTYNQYIIGTPFFTRYLDMKPASINPKYLNTRGGIYIANNSVELIHIGLAGNMSTHLRFSTKVSYSNNYPPAYFKDAFAKANQFSYLAKISYPLKKQGLEANACFAFDYGQLHAKNTGVLLSLKKSW